LYNKSKLVLYQKGFDGENSPKSRKQLAMTSQFIVNLDKEEKAALIALIQKVPGC